MGVLGLQDEFQRMAFAWASGFFDDDAVLSNRFLDCGPT
jgi:hypothetical protein